MEVEIGTVLQTYAVALLLAFGIEFAIETYIVPPFGQIPVIGDLRWLLIYVGLAASIGVSLFYSLDIVALLTGSDPTIVGMVITGTFIGGGVDVVHDTFRKYVLEQPEAE